MNIDIIKEDVTKLPEKDSQKLDELCTMYNAFVTDEILAKERRIQINNEILEVLRGKNLLNVKVQGNKFQVKVSETTNISCGSKEAQEKIRQALIDNPNLQDYFKTKFEPTKMLEECIDGGRTNVATSLVKVNQGLPKINISLIKD
jgi:predicted DNA-binding protein (UPF0251 family)